MASDLFEGDKINARALRNLVRAAVVYNRIKLKRKASVGIRAKVHKSKKSRNRSFFSLILFVELPEKTVNIPSVPGSLLGPWSKLGRGSKSEIGDTMCSTLSLASSWLQTYEYVAVWIEGIALVAIFIWDRVDSHSEHNETLQQIELTRRQAAATETAANAAMKSAGVAEMALKLAERADVLLNAASLTVDPTVVSTDGPINPYSRVSLELKNFGRTRAQNVMCRIGLVIPGVPESVPPRDPFILGPGGKQSVLFQTFKATLTKKTYEDIASGVIDLKFAGTVSYEDIFGESHTTTYKGLLDPKTGHFLLGDTDPRKAQDD
jgi:hypothetical protein